MNLRRVSDNHVIGSERFSLNQSAGNFTSATGRRPENNLNLLQFQTSLNTRRNAEIIVVETGCVLYGCEIESSILIDSLKVTEKT